MPRASRLRRAAVDICNRFCAPRPCGTACSGHDKPPVGMPTGTDRTHSAGRPTARCDSKRQELARDVPAGQFVEREGDSTGDQLLKDAVEKRVEDLSEAGEEGGQPFERRVAVGHFRRGPPDAPPFAPLPCFTTVLHPILSVIASTSSARATETFPAGFKGKSAKSQNMRDGPGWRDAIPALWTKVASYGLPVRRIRDL